MPIWFALVLIAGMFLGIWLYNHAPGNSLFKTQGSGKLNQVLQYIQKNYVDTIGKVRLEERKQSRVYWRALILIQRISLLLNFMMPPILFLAVLKASGCSSE